MYPPNYSNLLAKGKARKMVVRHIPEELKNSVTFPCTDTTIESILLKRGSIVNCLERDKKTYEKQQLIEGLNETNLHYTTALQYFTDNTDIDFAFLDFTGQMCETTLKTLQASKTPVIAITLLTKRERMPIFKDFKRDDAFKILFGIARYKEVERHAYNNEVSGAPMVTIILHKMKY
jgi:hypothetical protein